MYTDFNENSVLTRLWPMKDPKQRFIPRRKQSIEASLGHHEIRSNLTLISKFNFHSKQKITVIYELDIINISSKKSSCITNMSGPSGIKSRSTLVCLDKNSRVISFSTLWSAVRSFMRNATPWQPRTSQSRRLASSDHPQISTYCLIFLMSYSRAYEVDWTAAKARATLSSYKSTPSLSVLEPSFQNIYYASLVGFSLTNLTESNAQGYSCRSPNGTLPMRKTPSKSRAHAGPSRVHNHRFLKLPWRFVSHDHEVE